MSESYRRCLESLATIERELGSIDVNALREASKWLGVGFSAREAARLARVVASAAAAWQRQPQWREYARSAAAQAEGSDGRPAQRMPVG